MSVLLVEGSLIRAHAPGVVELLWKTLIFPKRNTFVMSVSVRTLWFLASHVASLIAQAMFFCLCQPSFLQLAPVVVDLPLFYSPRWYLKMLAA